MSSIASRVARSSNGLKSGEVSHIVNKGTGAGGSKTNLNGLSYEELTNLNTEYTSVIPYKYHKEVQFNNNNTNFMYLSKSNLFKYMIENGKKDTTIADGHGCKQPDECYINEANGNCLIIEKKFQQGSGSVCEKIQTPDFKLWQYQRVFPNYKIHYVYCLADWFKDNCKAELEYLKYKKITVFWGNDINYKSNIIELILNL